MSDEKESEAEAREAVEDAMGADCPVCGWGLPGPHAPTCSVPKALSAYRAAVLRSSEAETRELVERLRNRLWHDVGECGPTVEADAWLAARADKKEGGR